MTFTSYDSSNVFAEILLGKMPCKKVYDNENVLAFHDVNPQAKIHVLVIPKDHYKSYEDFIDSSFDIVSFFRVVKEVVKICGLSESGYRLVINHGSDGGQEVPHFHVHILGGESLKEINGSNNS